MKVAITCDYLIQKNHYTEVITYICELYPEAKIYCFVHKLGAIKGQIEQKKISSTYLSNKETLKTENDFYGHSYLLPHLSKKLFVSCEYDLIINISRGFSQGLKKCKRTLLVTYLYQGDCGDEFIEKNKINKTFVQKVFYSFVSLWAKRNIKKADVILVSRPDLLEKIPNSKLLLPPFRVSDYSLFPTSMFKHDYFAIETDGLSLENAKDLISWMKEWDYQFRFIGKDEHLNSLKTDELKGRFFGDRCSGEHAPVLAGSKALISFNTTEFPQLVLGTMCCGRPVIVANELKKWVSGTGTYFVSFHKGSLKAMIDEVFANEAELDGQKIRAHIIPFHDVKFKAQLKRLIRNAHEIT